jgi:hypothetical protein
MNKYLIWLIIAGFGAWLYNENRKNNTGKKPKLK